MTKIQRLTPESESRISEALAEVTDLTEDGMSPNDAIFKVASDKKIPSGHVRLMVRAYNTGNSLNKIQNASDLLSKAASFPLADAEEILERMFPTVVKTAADRHNSEAISSDYSMPPTRWLQRRSAVSRNEWLTKVAEAQSKEKSTDPRYAEYPHRAEKHALSKIAELKVAREQAKDAAVGAGYKVAADVYAIEQYFRQPTALPVSEVRENVTTLLGDSAGKLVDHVTKSLGSVTKSRDKQASSLSPGITAPVDWSKEPYSLIKAALANMVDFSVKHAQLQKVETEFPEKRAELLSPFGRGPEKGHSNSVWGGKLQLKSANIGMSGLASVGAAGAIGGAMSDFAAKLAPKSMSELIEDRIQDLSSPSHEDKLREIRTRTMIHELMTSDPIISGYSDDEVIDAYNQLAEVAPRSLQQRVTAQALLRKYLEQASTIDPFDTEQLMKIEKGLMERQNDGTPEIAPAPPAMKMPSSDKSKKDPEWKPVLPSFGRAAISTFKPKPGI